MEYIKQNFIDGQILTAAHLNHIEDGIINVDETYDPSSSNAQSGIAVSEAVAQAVAPMESKADMLALSSGSGKAVAVTDSAAGQLCGMNVYGESAQDGVPAPENPAEIVSVENPVVNILGANLIPYPYIGAPAGGEYYTDNGDGSIQVNCDGTQTGYNAFTLSENFTIHKGVTYYASGLPTNLQVVIYYVEDGVGKWYTGISNNATFTPSQTICGRLYLQVQPNMVCQGIVVPMIQVGTQKSAYEPYIIPQTVTIPYTLRGIKDSDGSWAARDEIVVDGKKGTVQYIQKVGVLTFSGARTWSDWKLNGNRVIFYTSNKKIGGDTLGYFTLGEVRQGFESMEQMSKSNRLYAYASSYSVYWYPDYTAMGLDGTEEKAVADQKLQVWLAGIPLREFTYVLAEPQVTDITDTEAGQALLALQSYYPNTSVTCDGDCAFTYKADTTNAYNHLLSRIAALEAAAVNQM